MLVFPEKKVQLHTHGPQSVNDAATDYDGMIKRAKELGISTIALTDHGTMTGLFPFKNKMVEAGLKPILGVEAYYQEDDDLSKKAHLILMAKDNIGFKAISKATTQANERIDSKGAPRMNAEILKRNFGPGSEGHDHVVATTACMQGYVNVILLSPFTLKRDIEKLTNKRDKYKSPFSSEYESITTELKEIDDSIVEKRSEKTAADKLAKKSFVKKEKTLKAAEGTESYDALKEQLDKEKAECAVAATTKKALETEIAKLTKEKKKLSAEKKKLEEDFDKWIALDDEINKLSAGLLSQEEVKEKAKKSLLELADMFGKNNVFVEVQYHGINEEAYCMPIIADIARECNIPMVAANDVHIINNDAKSRLKRQLLRSLRYNKWEAENVGDDQLYMKTNEELAEKLLEILPEDYVQEAINNTVTIDTLCNFENKKESHYPKYHSEIAGETSDGAIRRLALEGIEWRFPGKKGWTPKYKARLEYELKIICSMGYADYHLIVQDFLNIGRKMGHMPEARFNYMTEHIDEMSLDELVKYINEDQSEVGLTIGPGRGSAVGSLVCYLLGVTSIDPIKYDLLFERFLNPERVSMPDIDSDFASEVRDLVLKYVKKKYGENAVCGIMTKGTQAAKGSIRNCARLLGSKMYNDTKTFLSLGDQIAKDVPIAVGISFKSKMQFIYNEKTYGSIDDLNKAENLQINEKDLPDTVTYVTLADQLKEKYKANANALEIINNAELVEGTFTYYGAHAAGVIISDNSDVSDYVPLMWDDKKQLWKTQCDMVEAEDNGLLKMDFLGLKNLSIITKCLRLIKKRHGISIDIEKVEIKEDVLKYIYQTGETSSIFQFESGGMKQMLRKFKPSTIDDILLLNAAYRPGPMQYLDKIVNVKHKVDELTYLIPELEPILCNTYGSIIYQEQVMRICQDLAGYSLGGADMVRRYMSKKKAEKLDHERKAFVEGDDSRKIRGCSAIGISAEKANELFDQMTDFAKYAFNKSHACAYAFVSYYTAYLKYYYPTEYLCAVMDWATIDEIPGIIADCKKLGIKVLPPNINDSEIGFTIKDNDIIFGLGSVKNVGSTAVAIIKEREENGKFSSLKDYLYRGHVKKDSTESLIKAGALDCFSDNRLSMMKVLPEAFGYLKKINDKRKTIAAKTIEIEELDKEYLGKDALPTYSKKRTSLEKSLSNAKKAIEDTITSFNNIILPSIPEDKKTRLAEEKELLGVYVSSHPLDEYPSSEDLHAVPITDLVAAKEVTVFGIIKELRKTTRKADGKPMAFFKLEDRTGEIDIKCFTTAYEKCHTCVEEDAVVKIKGKCFEEASFFDDEETVKNISVTDMEIVNPVRQSLLLHVDNIATWTELVYPNISSYITTDGFPLVVHFRDNNTLQKAKFQVTHDFINNKLGYSVSVM